MKPGDWRIRPTKMHVYQALSDAVNLHIASGSPYRVPKELEEKLGGATSPAVYGHLPYNLFMTRIVQLCGPKTCVELGTYYGVGARHLAAGDPRTRVYTVDFDPACGQRIPPGWENITFIRSDTLRAVHLVPDPIELLFIDAEHTFEAVMAEFAAYSSRLADPSLVLFDDLYHNASIAEVWKVLGLDGFVSPTLHYTGFGVGFVGNWENGKPHAVVSYGEYKQLVVDRYAARRKELAGEGE